MTNISRRHLLGLTSIGAIVALAGCSSLSNFLNSSTQTIAVTLENAQAEAGAIAAALEAGVSTALSAGVLTGGAANTASAALSDLKAAVTAFQAVSAGDSVTQLAQSVVTAANTLLPLLPIDAGTKTAISLGLTLLSGLIGGLTSITVPTTAATPTTSTAVGASAVIAAPIPIPVPQIAR